MIRLHTKQSATLILVGLLSLSTLAGCSGGDDVADSSPTSEQASQPAADSDDSTGDQTTGPDASGDPDPEPQVFTLLDTQPTDPGPHPLLAWDAVDGATGYDLIVLDDSGEPYWAWSGSETSVHLGGVENPDAVGAWVFAPLTWIVTARDAEGQPLAMSRAAELTP